MTNRRTFLGLGVATAALPPRLHAEDAADVRDGLPAWANQAIGAAVTRYRAWKGADETISFTFVTDIHSRLMEMPAQPNFADSRFHVLFAEAAADRAGCDFLVDGGDHDYDNGVKSDDEALARMAVTEKVYRDYARRPVLFCLGNHDHGNYLGRKTRPISSELFGETFNGLADRHGFKLTFGANKSWGYFDVPGKKFRAIFCNTSDEAYYGMSAGQIAFVKQALESMPTGWAAAAFGHFCVFDEIGHWKQYQDGSAMKGKTAFIDMLQGFVKQRPNDLVGYFCGDSHFDNQLEYKGVNWTISQGYGGVGRDNLPWGARNLGWVRRDAEMLFELVAVKPSAGEFRVFRVGKGGEGCDRTCCYLNVFPRPAK